MLTLVYYAVHAKVTIAMSNSSTKKNPQGAPMSQPKIPREEMTPRIWLSAVDVDTEDTPLGAVFSDKEMVVGVDYYEYCSISEMEQAVQAARAEAFEEAANIIDSAKESIIDGILDVLEDEISKAERES